MCACISQVLSYPPGASMRPASASSYPSNAGRSPCQARRGNIACNVLPASSHLGSTHLRQSQMHSRKPSGRRRRELILRRTSADWWEDEEEFDAVAGEVLLPKTLYVLSVPSPSEAARSTPTLEQDPQKQQGEAEEWLVEYSAELLKGHLENGKCATVGFSGNETFGIASGVWSAWGASGPPYFKKVKKREALDRMAQGSNPGDAESLLKEIFSQNWRVELDAGLGVDLNPREHLLIVCTQPASMLLLETLGFKKLGKSDGGVVLSKVELDGWNTSDMKAEDLLPLEDWRDLKPRLIGRQYSHPPSF